MKDPAPHR